ncbi:MAG: hypothetical protein AAGB18_06375 [Pseudomonadota bacterium]
MSSSPMRTYIVRTAVFMGVYVALNVAAMMGKFDGLVGLETYLLAAAITLPISGHLWAALDCMKQADEFVSGMLARPFIVAAGLAIVLFSGWGFLEAYADVQHAPSWLIYPLFWAIYGVVAPFSARMGR